MLKKLSPFSHSPFIISSPNILAASASSQALAIAKEVERELKLIDTFAPELVAPSVAVTFVSAQTRAHFKPWYSNGTPIAIVMRFLRSRSVCGLRYNGGLRHSVLNRHPLSQVDNLDFSRADSMGQGRGL